jgi:uncharacterized protein (TIGR03000 family)
MRYSRLLGAALLCGVAVLTWSAYAGAGTKTTLKVYVPQSDATLWIDGKEISGEGTEREIPAPKLQPEKKAWKIQVLWEPNNYTKIWRTFLVTPKKGTVVVDMRKANPQQKDHIEVRWVPTPDDIVAAMCKLGRVGKNDVVYDLGCGDGVMVVMAVEKFGAKRGVGVDIEKKMVDRAKAKAKEHGVADKVTFRKGDVLKVTDLSEASVVLLYMGDDINNRLKPILRKTLKPGSRVVSHRFLMGEWKPTKTQKVTGADGLEYRIHLWEITEKDAKEAARLEKKAVKKE